MLFVPYGTVHSARNVGDSAASELATYIVEKGKPLVVPVKMNPSCRTFEPLVDDAGRDRSRTDVAKG